MSYDQVFPFLGLWFHILVLDGRRCELWAYADQNSTFSEPASHGDVRRKDSQSGWETPWPLLCLDKRGYYGNRGAWDLILRVMGSFWRTLRKGVIRYDPSGFCVQSWLYGGHKPGGHFTAPLERLGLFGLWEIKFQVKEGKLISSTEYELHEGRDCCLYNHCPIPTWWQCLAHWRCSINTC